MKAAGRVKIATGFLLFETFNEGLTKSAKNRILFEIQ